MNSRPGDSSSISILTTKFPLVGKKREGVLDREKMLALCEIHGPLVRSKIEGGKQRRALRWHGSELKGSVANRGFFGVFWV